MSPSPMTATRNRRYEQPDQEGIEAIPVSASTVCVDSSLRAARSRGHRNLMNHSVPTAKASRYEQPDQEGIETISSITAALA